jgi:beta-glucanase (GH16 family)
VRAKIDTRTGSWPAFWTLGTNGGWPGNGEVDIMEYYRGIVLANVAWAGGGGANGATWNSAKNLLTTFPKDWPEHFHTWRMDWDEKAIKLFLDDVQVNYQDLSKTINAGRGGRGTAGAPATGNNPFLNAPVYLLLNQAIGGQQGGDTKDLTYPVKFYVDYVRVWQK